MDLLHRNWWKRCSCTLSEKFMRKSNKWNSSIDTWKFKFALLFSPTSTHFQFLAFCSLLDSYGAVGKHTSEEKHEIQIKSFQIFSPERLTALAGIIAVVCILLKWLMGMKSFFCVGICVQLLLMNMQEALAALLSNRLNAAQLFISNLCLYVHSFKSFHSKFRRMKPLRTEKVADRKSGLHRRAIKSASTAVKSAE